jgi:hypothetical protein
LRKNKFPSKFFNLIFAISAIVTGAVVFGVVERRSREGGVWTFVVTGKLCCLFDKGEVLGFCAGAVFFLLFSFLASFLASRFVD